MGAIYFGRDMLKKKISSIADKKKFAWLNPYVKQRIFFKNA